MIGVTKRSRSELLPIIAALIAVVLFTAGRAHAQGRGIVVSVNTCTDIDALEVERLLGIELARMADRDGGEPLRVELSCVERVLRIVAIDPVTDKRLSRDVELDGPTQARDRTVALLVSQLFLTSWAELLLPPPVTPRVVSTRVNDAERLSRDAIAPSVGKTPFGVDVTGGVRMRSLEQPVVDGFVSVRPGVMIASRWRLFLDLGYEGSQATRTLGAVDFWFAAASVGVGWRVARSRIVSLDVTASIGAAYARASGNPTGSALGSTVDGVLAQLGLGIGPTFWFDSIHLGLELVGGATFPRGVAQVAGDADLSLSGGWFGASIVFGVGETTR